MKYISIEKFINYVANNEIPKTYWLSGHHKRYIANLNYEEYQKWLWYLQEHKKQIKEKWKQENREYVLLQAKQYRQTHKEERREYNRRYYRENSEYRRKKLEYNKKHKKTEKAKATAHRYYLKHRQLYIDRAKWWYEDHKQKKIAQVKKWLKTPKGKECHTRWLAKYYQKNKEKLQNLAKIYREKHRGYSKQYYQKNKEKLREYHRKYARQYRAKLKNKKEGVNVVAGAVNVICNG